MVRRAHSRQAPQAPKPHITQSAGTSGIVAIRRSISSESYPLFENVSQLLEPELRHSARLFEANNLAVTVIGFTRFNDQHRKKGPKSKDIIDTVPSARNDLEVRLGILGVYGSGRKHKLGFSLASDALTSEIRAFEQAFTDRGSPLRNDPNVAPGEIKPHCSLALLYEENVGYFEDARTLDRLNNFMLGEMVTRSVMLAGIE